MRCSRPVKTRGMRDGCRVYVVSLNADPDKLIASRPNKRLQPLPVLLQSVQHIAVTRDTQPGAAHTMWMPRSCRWMCMIAASTPYAHRVRVARGGVKQGCWCEAGLAGLEGV